MSGVPADGEVPETSSGNSSTSFYADLSASGDITAWVKPLIQLGIVFNPSLNVPSASIDLELDTYATLYGSAGVGTTQTANVCYGANAGIELSAAVNAPTLFDVSLNQKHTFVKRDFDLIQQTCYSPESFQDTTCDACALGPTS
ncbi:uncharacterized protein K444DRAFT_93154 [Hyaloscypha bicolor E]|uniref:Uncharacterized protein n=1 Tax=Hyaloscypha bicolor E TaxID=1095630 RepID=A0A2J6SVU2_9HELO|nr:uncharacterized protein K444DRAFT_93154 [Hyaloscypha bicolor E]PMD54892.1 hypothetical protein K444DRAFT_93154 [Hyaloscypha bicolor E]